MDIRIAVGDDNFIFVNEVKQICEEYFASKNATCHVECFFCGEEVLHAVDRSGVRCSFLYDRKTYGYSVPYKRSSGEKLK